MTSYCLKDIEDKQNYIYYYNKLQSDINNIEYNILSNFDQQQKNLYPYKTYFDNLNAIKNKFSQIPLPDSLTSCCFNNTTYIGTADNGSIICGCPNKKPFFNKNTGKIDCSINGCIDNNSYTLKTGITSPQDNNYSICDCSENGIWSDKLKTCVKNPSSDINEINTRMNSILLKVVTNSNNLAKVNTITYGLLKSGTKCTSNSECQSNICDVYCK